MSNRLYILKKMNNEDYTVKQLNDLTKALKKAENRYFLNQQMKDSKICDKFIENILGGVR